MFRRLEATSRQSMLSDLAALGITEETLPHLEIWVDMALCMNVRCFEGLLDGQYQSIDDCLDVLQSMGAHVVMSAMMGKRP